MSEAKNIALTPLLAWNHNGNWPCLCFSSSEFLSDMRGGEKGLLNLKHHHHPGKKQQQRVKGVPKGCLAIMIGHQGEKQHRFVVPVMYFNHPLFMQLLKEAEEEYGFDQKGTITIPCQVEEFRYVQGMIEKEQQHYHHNYRVGCFRV